MNKYRLILRDVLYVSKLTNIRNKKLRIAFSALVSNATGLADILIILAFSKILTGSEIVDVPYMEIIIDLPFLVPVFVVLRYFLNFLGKYNIYSLTKDIEQSLKVHILKEVYKKGNYSLADASYSINTLSVHVSYFFNAFANIASSLIQIVVFTVYLSFGNVQIISILLVLIAILYFPSKFILGYLRNFTEITYQIARKNIKTIQRIIDNLYLVKILQTHKKEIENFSENLTNLYNTERKKFALNDLNVTFPNFIVIFAFSILLLFNRFKSTLTLDFIGVTIRLVQQLASINSSMNMLINAHVHLEVLLQIEENKNSEDNYEKQVDKSSKYAVKLENIDFSFANSNENFYENLNLVFEKNKHHIITGVNGSGKSTLMGIMAGSHHPSSGKITKNTESLGYVGATPFILDDTLRTNLLYGSTKKVDDETLLHLIDEFRLFNEKRKDVLDSIISRRDLSSGQMQKISFMRAIVTECELLFLDESTANLDTRTKKLIISILKKKNLTIINSTHNPEDFEYDNHFHISISENDERKIEEVL